MPNIIREEVQGFAHCMQFLDELGEVSRPGPLGETMTDEKCPGYAQQRVPIIREVVEHLYGDYGAGSELTGAGRSGYDVYYSTEHLQWADPEQAPCPHCGVPRELSTQERPSYPRLSGQPQDQLLRFKREEREAAVSTANAMQSMASTLADRSAQDERIAALEKELAEVRGDVKPARKPAAKAET